MPGARAIPALMILAFLVACGSSPSTASQPELPSASAASAPASDPPPTSEVSREPAPTLELPRLGRPYEAAAILDMLAASRRPGGVPDALQTDAIARQVASTIWTYRGAPWVTSATSGTCGPSVCTLELAGTLEGGQGEDLWVFEVAGGAVTLVTAELRAVPPELVEELDAIARAVEPSIDRNELVLGTVAWLLPADRGHFRLSYRSGGEEGSCRMDVVVDANDGSLEASDTAGC